MTKQLAIFLHSAAYDRIYQAVNMLQIASGMGRKCHLFLFYHALASYMANEWDEVGARDTSNMVDYPPGVPGRWAGTLERNFEIANTPSLYELLERAKQGPGGVRLCACSASVQILGFEPADVGQKVGDIVGLATMLDLALDSQIFYI